jgi:hypothetical protein
LVGDTVEKCLNCQYYDRRNARPNDGRAPVMWGQCRRHSPQVNPMTATKAYLVEGAWPLVRDDDWCGEWRAPTRTSIAPSRFAPRSADIAGVAPRDAPSTMPSETPVAIAAD